MRLAGWVNTIVSSLFPQRVLPRRRVRRISVEQLEVRALLAPVLVFHVDNRAAAGGNGTFERPLNFLPASVDPSFNIIFVHRGDGTSRNYTGGITLSTDQRLLGEGFAHQVGDTPLPGNTPGPFPILSQGTVNLSTRTEVAGFQFRSYVNPAIRGVGIRDFLVHDVTFTTIQTGISLATAVGQGRIRNATFSVVSTNGIVVDNSLSDFLDLQISNMILSNAQGATGVNITARDGSAVGTIIHGSQIRNTTTGIRFFSTNNGHNQASVVGTQITNNITGLLERADGGRIAANVQSNNISNNTNGVSMQTVNNGILDQFQVNNSIQQNTQNGDIANANTGILDIRSIRDSITNNTLDGIDAIGTSTAVLNVSVVSGSVANNGQHGVQAVVTNANMNFNAIQAGISTNGRSGIDVQFINSLGTLGIVNSNISINTLSGIHFETSGSFTNTTNFVCQNNLMEQNQDAIFLDRRGNTGLFSRIANNQVTRNRGTGLLFAASGNANVTTTSNVLNNTFTNNDRGVDYTASADAVLVAKHYTNTYTTHAQDAIRVRTINGAHFGRINLSDFSQFDGEMITDFGDDGFEFTNNSTATDPVAAGRLAFHFVQITGNSRRTTITDSDNTAVGANSNGIEINSASNLDAATGRPQWTILATDISMVDADGIRVTNTGGNNMGVSVGGGGPTDFVTVDQSGDDGFQLSSTSGVVNTVLAGNSNFTRTSFTNSGRLGNISSTTEATRGDGIYIVQPDLVFSTINLVVFGVSSSFNGGRGVNIDHEAAGPAIFGSTSSFTLGSALNPASVNVFSNNSQQGVIVKTVFRTDPGVNIGGNPLVFDINPTGTPSSAFFQNTNPSQNRYYQQEASTDIVQANLRVENSFVQFNGTVTTPSDGLLLVIGTSTRLRATINANTFGGNSLFDFNTFVVRSVNHNRTVTDNEVSGPPVLDRVALDPVAHLDLAFGVFSSTGGTTPDSRRGNTGDRIDVHSVGNLTTSWTGDTGEVGTFSNENYHQGAGRRVYGRFRIYSDGLLDGTPIGNPPGNSFFQLGVPQDIQTTFEDDSVSLNTHDGPIFASEQIQSPGTFPFAIP